MPDGKRYTHLCLMISMNCAYDSAGDCLAGTQIFGSEARQELGAKPHWQRLAEYTLLDGSMNGPEKTL